MNATVTKSAKSTKKTATRASGTSAVKSASAKSSRSAAKSPVKTFAKKIVKALTDSLTPVKKSAAKPAAKKAPVKSAVKSTRTPAKANVPGGARSGAAKTAKQPAKPATKAKPAVKPAAKKTVATAGKSTSVAATSTRKAPPPEPVANSRKPAPGPIGKIQQPVVSKASEVATKTTKSTPSTDNDGALLTEAQILKMSEKDYMNPAQLAFFKNRLQQLERDLLKNADETTEHLRETVLVPDPADRATIEEEHALELRTRDRERKLLKKVQQSIASIAAGDYGWCEETGEPIGIPRLLARPTATLSLEAQQRRELKQKLYGD